MFRAASGPRSERGRREGGGREREIKRLHTKKSHCFVYSEMTWHKVAALFFAFYGVTAEPREEIRMGEYVCTLSHSFSDTHVKISSCKTHFYPFGFLQISQRREEKKWQHVKWPTPCLKGLSNKTGLPQCIRWAMMLGTKGWGRTGLYYHRTLSGLGLGSRWSPGLIESINSSHYVIKDGVWWAEWASLGLLRC